MLILSSGCLVVLPFFWGCEKKEKFSEDLPEIIKRGKIRVITRNNYRCYFLYRGEPRGFEYELAEKFAAELGIKIEVVIPPQEDDLVPWLVEGKGDLIAVPLKVDPELSKLVKFADSYRTAQQVLVVPSDNEELKELSDLARYEVWLPKSSKQRKLVKELEKRLRKRIRVVHLPGDLESEEVLELLADGKIGATIVEDGVVWVEMKHRSGFKIAFPVSESYPVAWAVRKSSVQLAEAVNKFWREVYRSAFYNILYRRYFELPPRRYRQSPFQISPFDHLVKKYAGEYGLDWLIVVAQMYEESRFAVEAQSWQGALGLMQLMPHTITETVVGDPFDPEQNIQGGVKYISKLMRMFADVPEPHRLKFVLAAYNLGPEHVKSAQYLARELDLDPFSWEKGVEKVLPLLSRREYYQRVPTGYCRGEVGVEYVNNVLARAEAYRQALKEPTLVEEREKVSPTSAFNWKQYFPFFR